MWLGSLAMKSMKDDQIHVEKFYGFVLSLCIKKNLKPHRSWLSSLGTSSPRTSRSRYILERHPTSLIQALKGNHCQMLKTKRLIGETEWHGSRQRACRLESRCLNQGSGLWSFPKRKHECGLPDSGWWSSLDSIRSKEKWIRMNSFIRKFITVPDMS